MIGEQIKIEKDKKVGQIDSTANLVLVGEGVFPIVKDENGQTIEESPNTGIQVAGTIQGEGKLAGTPSLFIRLASCNLRCIWQMEDGSLCRCDTSYASFHPEGMRSWSVEEIVSVVKYNLGNIKHVVITGGEPVLQKGGLTALCKKLKLELGVHITMETNGTLFDGELAKWIDLFSISPKLSNSVPSVEKMKFYDEKENGASRYHHESRRNIVALQSYIDLVNCTEKELQFKFVVGRTNDETEIYRDYLNVLNDYDSQDIMLMPLGATPQQIEKSNPIVLKMCLENGWKYSPRIHIALFGTKRGV